MTVRRRSFLAPCAAPSRASNSDEPAIADCSNLRLDTFRLDEQSRGDGRATSMHHHRSFFSAVAAAALVAASSLSSPFVFPLPARASAGGDALITFNKRADAAADAVAGALLGALPRGSSSSSSSSASSSTSSAEAAAAAAAAEREAAAAAALLKEVRDVVALNYLDTRSDSSSGAGASTSSSSSGRNGNFDPAAWDAAVEAELTGGGGGSGLFGRGAKRAGKGSGPKLKDVAAARRAARRLLAFSLSDPYSRFLSPEEFAAMARYDITGVGLNLGSAEEYERKVGESPPGASSSGPSSSAAAAVAAPSAPPSAPPPQPNDSPGVWVIGVIRGSPSDAAGVRQGDRVVAVDGREVDPSRDSAFDVASRIQGAGVAEANSGGAEGKGGGGGGGEPGKPPAAAATKSINESLFSSFPLLSSSSSSSSKGSSTRKLSLDVLRRSDGSRARVELEAPVASAAVSPVNFKLVEGGGGDSKNGDDNSPIGVIKLDSFNARARSDAAAAVSELLSRGAKSFVLDLRGNRGGLVSEGAEVAALFLERGSPVATTLGRAPSISDDAEKGGAATSSSSSSSSSTASSDASTTQATRTTTRTLSTTAQPLVPPEAARLTVLVDERTASAGEIVAGALRDNCRAPLVAVSPPTRPPLQAAARRTYGKGLIQSVYELGDGSGLVLTVGKYLTPSGRDIDREGLVADLEVSVDGSRAAAAAAAAAAGVPTRAEADAVLDACLRGRGRGG